MERHDSFILFTNVSEVLAPLNLEQKGELFQAILDYENGKEPMITDPMVNLAFIPIRQGLDVTDAKWEKERKARSEAGKRGMQSRWAHNEKHKNPDGVIDENPKEKPKKSKGEVKEKPKKDTYGLAGNVTLTQDEYNKLVAEFGMTETQKAIQYLDDYIADKGYKSKSNYSAMRRWVFNAVRERDQKAAKNDGLRPVDRFFADVEGAFYDNGGNQENIFCG